MFHKIRPLQAGVLLLGVGIYLGYKSAEKTDTDRDIWVSKTVFGIPIKTLFNGEVYKNFENLSEALAEHYFITFSPIKIDSAEEIFKKTVDTEWYENGLNKDSVHFVTLLPGYKENLSDWNCTLIGLDADDVNSNKRENATRALEAELILSSGKIIPYGNIAKKRFNPIIETVQKPEGLYIFIRKVFSNQGIESVALTFNYWLNKELTKEPIVKTLYEDE